MPSMQIFINTRDPIGPNVWTGKEGIQHVINFLNAVQGGQRTCDSIKFGWNDSVSIDALSSLGQACGLVTMASSSGAVGVVVGGVTATVTWAASDTASSTALAAAIRALTTVNGFVTASNLLMKATCATVLAGTTIEVGGAVFTAIANGVTPTVHGQFSIGANDTATALNLATAINRHPSCVGRYRAASIAAVLYVGLPDNRTPLPIDAIRNPLTSAGATATTITLDASVPTAGVSTMLFAAQPGLCGNFVTAVASGTNVTYATNGTAGQLGSGTGALIPTFTNDVVP